jgi:hypothetical protein
MNTASRKKTHWCDQCTHYDFKITGKLKDGTEKLDVDCKKGHKPRFYKPKLFSIKGVPKKIDFNSFGYKRRCGDFDPIERGSKS